MRVHVIAGAEFAVQEARHQVAEEAVVAREADAFVREAALGERGRQQIELRALSGAVNSFEDDEFPAWRHARRTV